MSGEVYVYEDPGDAQRRFRALSRATRRSIHEHARRGELHPDPRTARIARSWATSLDLPTWEQDGFPLVCALFGPLQAQPLVSRLLGGSGESPYNDGWVFLTGVVLVVAYGVLRVRTHLRGRRILALSRPSHS